MAISFQSHVVSDLCLGKPALKSISVASSVGDALVALKASDDAFLSVWNTAGEEGEADRRCVGRVCMVDVLSFLCKEDNLVGSPVSALQSPVSAILPKDSALLVKHVDPSTSLLEAIGLILEGAQNLIVPIQSTTTTTNSKRKQLATRVGPFAAARQDYCWLTQEDLLRFIMGRIGVFTPTAAYSVEDLDIIRTDVPTVDYNSPASRALELLLARSLTGQTPVAIVDNEAEGVLVGEISPSALSGSDESAAPAIMALSCGDLMAYIDSWGGTPECLIKAIRSKLKDTGSEGLLALLEDDYETSLFSSSSSSSDDEDSLSSSLSSSPSLRRHSRSGSYSGRRAEEITCQPGSSLIAVMIQAIAHRASYVWVVDEGFGLVGIVTFTDMLGVFYEHMKCMFEELGDEELRN